MFMYSCFPFSPYWCLCHSEEYDSEDEEDEEELQRMQEARDRLATVAKLRITHTSGMCGPLVLVLVLVLWYSGTSTVLWLLVVVFGRPPMLMFAASNCCGCFCGDSLDSGTKRRDIDRGIPCGSDRREPICFCPWPRIKNSTELFVLLFNVGRKETTVVVYDRCKNPPEPPRVIHRTPDEIPERFTRVHEKLGKNIK